MYFRCGICLGASWCEGARPPGAGDSVRCESCGRVHRVAPSEQLGDTIARHYAASLRLSNERSIDMASAYSVLLGVLDEDRLAGLGHGGTTSSDGAGAAEHRNAPSTAVLTEFDPAFREAVDSGHLTVEEAIRRGDRRGFAVNLAVRHRVSLASAYAVADNRLSLHQAVARSQTGKPVRRRRSTDHVTPKHKVLAVGAAVLFVSVSSWDLWCRNHGATRGETRSSPARVGLTDTPPVGPATAGERERIAPARGRPRGLVDVRHNPAGEIVESVGPDPRAVLAAFCGSESTSSAAFEPLEITETVPRRNEARLGVFRDLAAGGRSRAIWMRKDWRTRRWIAGDGKVAIPVRDTPDAIRDLAAELGGEHRPQGP